jgi:triacylglycerol lipase
MIICLLMSRGASIPVLFSLVMAAVSGCSDAALLRDSGAVFTPLDGTIGGTGDSSHPIDSGLNDADATGDAGAEDTGGTGDAGDAGGDEGLTPDSGPPDAGPRQCPTDLFASSRPAGDIKFGDSLSGDLVGDCDAARYSIVLAAGQGARIRVSGVNLYPGLHVYGPGRRGLLAGDVKYWKGALATVEFLADLPGEYFAVVAQAGLRGASPYTIAAECTDKCDLKATRYPILLAHGMSGFENIGPVEYFYRVKDTFAPEGYDIHIASLDAYNSSEKRGTQLAGDIDRVLAATFAEKVNLIAHSQGGIDARFAISALSCGDRVGVLNTVATPHRGTPVADIVLEDPTGAGKPILDALLTLMGAVLDGAEAEQNAWASITANSEKYMTGTFNPLYADDPRVTYKSWAGKTCLAWEGCGDSVSAFLVTTYEFIKSKAGDNDGMCPVESARWTGFQSVLAADHMKEVGQLAGMTGSFDYISFYRAMIEAMSAEGF